MKCLRLFFMLGALVAAVVASAQFGDRANTVDWRTFKSGTISRFNDQAMLVLNTENDFASYWERATGNPAGTAPKGVDWTKEKLVAIHLGNRPTSGFGLVVQSISKSGAYATINAFEETPLKGQYVAQVVSSPWVIVKVERGVVDFRLNLGTRQAHPAIILGPGGAYIGPKQNDGAGWVDPKNQCDWGTYQTGQYSRIADQQMFVLNTENDFIAYYEKAFGGRAPRVGIDWYRYRLVAVHLGERETGGFAVSVRNVIKNGVYATVRAVEETPIPGQQVSRRATSPFVIIRVERNIVQFQLDMSAAQARDDIVIIGGGAGGGRRGHGGGN